MQREESKISSDEDISLHEFPAASASQLCAWDLYLEHRILKHLPESKPSSLLLHGDDALSQAARARPGAEGKRSHEGVCGQEDSCQEDKCGNDF